MRHIGQLSDRRRAGTFRDYLLTLGIEASVEEEEDGWSVWIHDEDDVPRAREQLDAFRENPDEAHFHEAADAASALREEEEKLRRRAKRNVVDVRRRWRQPASSQSPVTFGLIVLSMLVSWVTDFGGNPNTILPELWFAEPRVINGQQHFDPDRSGLTDVLQGEVWRLVTPIFIHMTWLHLLFNMLWLYRLGMAIEFRQGSLRFLLIVLIVAVASNVLQCLLSQWLRDALTSGTIAPGSLPAWVLTRIFGLSGPAFGGMSGVVYGLFGYIWMKSRYDPASTYFMDTTTVVLMMVFLFLCMTGLVGPIANTAHAVGLVTGMVLAYAPILWRRTR
ncbi:MAG: rhomboid family intramembrane serine protease [Planctomycetaceae bacterium]